MKEKTLREKLWLLFLGALFGVGAGVFWQSYPSMVIGFLAFLIYSNVILP